MKLNWGSDKVKKTVESTIKKRVSDACTFLEREIKGSFKYKSPPPSRPGEVPHVVTGNLKRSISSKVENLTGKVGIMAEKVEGDVLSYGIKLELGSKNIAPRPYIRPALERNKDKILSILSEPL